MPKLRTHAGPLTKAHLETRLAHLHDGIRSEMHENSRQIISHLEGRLSHDIGQVNQNLSELNAKLDAIMSGEVLVRKDQVLVLIRQLKAQGIKLNENKIFSSK